MKVRITMSGTYGFSPTGDPKVVLEEKDIGEIMDFEKEYARMLLDDNWAEELDASELEEVEAEEEEPEDDDPDLDPDLDFDPDAEIEDVEAHLNGLIKDKPEDEAKQIIQDFGKLRLDITVSKAFTVENMIAKIVEAV